MSERNTEPADVTQALLTRIAEMEDGLVAMRALIRQMSVQMSLQASTALKPLRDADWAADVLGMTKQTVYYLARIGALPCVRLSTQSIKFNEDTVYEWIRNGGSKRES